MDKFILSISLLAFLLGFLPTEAAPACSLVTHLPGFNGTFASKHYAGYMRLGTKNLYYYFVSSERNPAKDPLVLWVNGGPGCSSFDGFVYEHGPFNFEEGKPKGSMPKLHLNRYSWSKVSNFIYLDSPVGVGYSFSNNKTDYNLSDIQTATDTHNFLLKWLKEFPEFILNPLYLTGESYGGVFVPTLAKKIVQGIKSGKKPLINFKGYIIGNGVTQSEFDDRALVPFAHGMGLISDEIFEEVQTACKENYEDPSKSTCLQGLDKVDKAISDLNIYNILEPCYHYPSENTVNATSLPASFQQLGMTEKPLPVRKRMFGRAWPLRQGFRSHTILWPELARNHHIPCVNDVVATLWLNNKAVRKALHAEPEKIAGPWELCTNRIRYTRGQESMIPYHVNLTKSGYRALIYSGDHDMCVPFTGTQAWTRSLGYKTVDEWRPWKCNGQVAGYLHGYEHNLTFITIKGSGHTVPEYKPREALHFYSRWLEGKPI